MARKSRKNTPIAVAEPTDNLTTKAVLSLDKQAKPYQVGIYARLSFESEANKERDTVDTQIAYIREFVKEQDDMVEVQVYADISVTGTTFERPEFDRMIQDIRAGKINTVITRDLSRLVQLIFELAIKGMKYTEIANYLNDNGYDSIFEYYQKIGVKRCYERDIGEHMWSASTVMEILYNEVYIGSVINNKTADNIDTGHQVVQRDKEDWIIVENCHEPLVSVEDFKLAHKMIARREVTKRKPNGKWRKSYIRCGVCGKGLYKYGNKSSYRCHNGHVSRIRGEELKSALLDIARNMALAQLQEFELKTDGGNCPDNLEREIESLKKSKAHYAKLKFEIYDDYTKANITRDQMAKKTAEVKQKIAEIESLITQKQETLDMQKDLFLDAKQEQLTKLSKLDEFDEEVIRYLIDYVLVYDNEHIEIRWNFDDFQAG